jgi:outer membrane protein
MKHLCMVGALALILVLGAVIGIATEASAKVGIIDTQEVLRDSRAAKDARAILLEDLKEKSGLFSRKQDEVRLLEEELKIKGEKMEGSERRGKTELLSREVKNLQRFKDDLEEELNKKNVELTQRILVEVGEIVNEYRKKNKFSLILEKKTVVSHDEGIDITKDIIKLYDARKK